MAFTQATAPIRSQTNTLLSADNPIPERHIVIETVRNAAPLLGLSASVISTLDAMLSCLAPKRNHHTVFASNATLTFRRNGISDRTIRRHAATLQEAGLIQRRDSPNGKRYTKHSRHQGTALRFGFDLSPLFERLHQIATLATKVLEEREQINYLRCKIRTAANYSLQSDPNNEHALNTLKILRRKLSLNDCEHLLDQQRIVIEAEATGDYADNASPVLSANDGHSVRHHHKSNKEYIDKQQSTSRSPAEPQVPIKPITIPELLTACPEATQFSLRKINTVHDVISHARTLAPMIGISVHNYDTAQDQLGSFRAAITVWAIMQFHEKIRSVGAYFCSITAGAKSNDFSPEHLIRRLAKAQNYKDCPRTIVVP